MLEYARIFAYRTDMNLIGRDGRTNGRDGRTDAQTTLLTASTAATSEPKSEERNGGQSGNYRAWMASHSLAMK
jgi:hypothetical protein